MAVNNNAISAYTNALNQLKNAEGTTAGGVSNSASAGSSTSSVFSDLVEQSMKNVVNTQNKSEQVSAAALQGKASMTDVVMAINDAEMALNKVLAVRDKVIDAYKTVINTQI